MAEALNRTADTSQPTIYQIRVKGHLGSQWKDWFGGLADLPSCTSFRRPGSGATESCHRAVGGAEGVRKNENPGGFVARYDCGHLDQLHNSRRIQWHRNSA